MLLRRLVYLASGLIVLTLILSASQARAKKFIKCPGREYRRSQLHKSRAVKTEDHVTTAINSTDVANSQRVLSDFIKETPRLSAVKPGVHFHVNWIFPNLASKSGDGPVGSEGGAVALMPWADRLYMVSEGGNDAGLYEIDSMFRMQKVKNHNSTFANRLLHRQTNQIIIGAWVIDMWGQNIRAFEDLLYVRVASTAEHLTSPETMVYMLGMDGPLWECDVTSMNCSQIFDLVEELAIPTTQGEQPHFKAAHTMDGRLVVACVTTTRSNGTRGSVQHGGRLAEWSGPGSNWTIIDKAAFVEVTGGRLGSGQTVFAVGWDEGSVILKVYDGEDEDTGSKGWLTYRLPKATRAIGHSEWPRVREVETGRYLMDMHGMFYELSPLGWAGGTWGIRPISQHLRVIPDFTSYRGFLVLGGNQVSSQNDPVTGQSQSNLWYGKTDDLWSFGKPQGRGAVWLSDDVKKGHHSDPLLMTGFDKKVLHLILHEDGKEVSVDIELDVTGTAGYHDDQQWFFYQNLRFSADWRGQLQAVVLPDGLGAYWVRLTLRMCTRRYPRQESASCRVTAYFHYS